MSWVEQREELQRECTSIYKPARLVPLNTPNDMAITVGPWILIPKDWSVYSVRNVMEHECRHAQQYQWCGFGIHPIVGIPLFLLIYGLVLLPCFLALPRVFFELDAMAWSTRRKLRDGRMNTADARAKATRFAKAVFSWKYGKPFFWSLGRRWFINRVEQIIREEVGG